MAPDTKVDLAIVRNGSETTVSLTLGTLPKNVEAKSNVPTKKKDSDSVDLAKLGLTLAPAGRVAGAGNEGVVVTDVDSSGVAADHGFSTGDVILEVAGKQVSTPADVRKEIASVRSQGKHAVLMRVKKAGSNTRFVALPIKEG